MALRELVFQGSVRDAAFQMPLAKILRPLREAWHLPLIVRNVSRSLSADGQNRRAVRASGISWPLAASRCARPWVLSECSLSHRHQRGERLTLQGLGPIVPRITPLPILRVARITRSISQRGSARLATRSAGGTRPRGQVVPTFGSHLRDFSQKTHLTTHTQTVTINDPVVYLPQVFVCERELP
jgi:hypothetical protein